jgi:hypothetical protein
VRSRSDHAPTSTGSRIAPMPSAPITTPIVVVELVNCRATVGT